MVKQRPVPYTNYGPPYEKYGHPYGNYNPLRKLWTPHTEIMDPPYVKYGPILARGGPQEGQRCDFL